jgi:hypothetical protein
LAQATVKRAEWRSGADTRIKKFTVKMTWAEIVALYRLSLDRPAA